MNTFLLLSCLYVFTGCVYGTVVHDYYWRDFSFGYIPDDAVEIDNGGKYVGQIYNSRAILVATIYPHLGEAIGEMSGKVVKKENIKILCTSDESRLYWEYVDFHSPVGDELKNAIRGGYYFNSHYYFIGKAYDSGEWRAGKVISWERNNRGLALWDSKGKYKQIKQFYLLKYNSTTTGI
ncbi:hypothetical protein Trydic_g5718 [Trypoxylus dichotomus]